MAHQKYTDEELTEICEDAFVNVKEACKRLQEKTKCSNEVVISMLGNVAEFYLAQGDADSPGENTVFKGIEGLKA